MLYDSLTIKEVVDSESAQEFMKEATKLAKSWELEDIGRRLEKKSQLFGEILSQDNIATLTEENLSKVIGSIFTIRRKTKRIIKANGLENIRSRISDLLYGENKIEDRFDEFVNSVAVDIGNPPHFTSELVAGVFAGKRSN